MHGHVAGPLVHDLNVLVPGALGEIALDLELAKLGLVVGIRDGAWTKPVADREADVVRRHDLADLVPVRVEEVLLVMCEAPLRHDGAAAADDARDALGRPRDEAKQNARVDREVVHALLGLLDERLTEEVPRELLGPSSDLLECLVDRDGSDGDGAVAQDPLARLVDVVARTEVHHGVGAPAGRPHELLDLFLDARGHSRVADVGVDLHEEVATDDHRLDFGMVDVGRDDRPSTCDLITHELRCDHLRDVGTPGLARMLVMKVATLRTLLDGFAAHGLADGDVLHLRRDLAATRVVHLCDALSGAGATRCARALEGVGAVRLGDAAGFKLGRIPPRFNPRRA